MDFYTPEQDKKRAAVEGVFDDALPWALIIGDSISQGYTPFVREYLTGKWNVTRPKANCGDTNAGLRNIDAWLTDRHWNVVHFNWGLHDTVHRHPESKAYGYRDKVRGKRAVTIEQYGQNLRLLVELMKQSADRLIWANTTIVPPNEEGRFEGDEIKYNAVACEIMKELGVEINDLHTTTAGFGPELFSAPSDVHFTEAGYRILARQVAQMIHGEQGT